MTIRASIKLFTISAALAAGALAAPLARADALRVCADPDNLPFSKSEGPEKGLYVELAEMVAKRLGTPIEYTWWLTYYERRALRNTIQQDDCDAVFARLQMIKCPCQIFGRECRTVRADHDHRPKSHFECLRDRRIETLPKIAAALRDANITVPESFYRIAAFIGRKRYNSTIKNRREVTNCVSQKASGKLNTLAFRQHRPKPRLYIRKARNLCHDDNYRLLHINPDYAGRIPNGF